MFSSIFIQIFSELNYVVKSAKVLKRTYPISVAHDFKTNAACKALMSRVQT
jgi:hypothetical protein